MQTKIWAEPFCLIPRPVIKPQVYSSIFNRERIDSSWGAAMKMPNTCQYPCLPRKMPRYLWTNQTATFWYFPEKELFLVAVPVWQPGLCSFQMYLFLSGLKPLWTCPHNRHALPTLQKKQLLSKYCPIFTILREPSTLGQDNTILCYNIKK